MPHHLLGRGVAALAASLVLAGVATSPSAAAAKTTTARLIEPKSVASFTGLAPEDTWNLYRQPEALLRADGSFGYFSQRYGAPHDDVPMELVTWGGPVPAGQLRKQNVVGAPGGTLPFPGVTASGVDGFDWAFDDAEWRLPKPGETPDPFSGWVPSEPSLIAIDDRGIVARRVSLDFGPRTFTLALVPTGAGLRIITRTDDAGLDVRRADGTLVAHVRQLGILRHALGQRDGSVLLAGWSDNGVSANWSTALLRASAGGKIGRVVDKKGQGSLGDPLTRTSRGVLLAPPEGDFRETLTLLTDRGQTLRRKLSTLRLRWSKDCRDDGEAISLDWATAGPSGDPVIGVSCVAEGDRTTYVLDSFTVGLDSKLDARWAVKGGTQQPIVGSDGRLYSAQTLPGSGGYAFDLVAWREPGAGKPRLGHVVSVQRDGAGAVATIRCNAPLGTVCSGRAVLRRAGGGSTSLPYALRGRPGRSAAVIRRHFAEVPLGGGALQVKLTR